MGKRMSMGGWMAASRTASWAALLSCPLASLAQAVESAAASPAVIASESSPVLASYDEPPAMVGALPMDDQSNRPGLLARWRKQLNRYTPHVVSDASTWSLGDNFDTSPPDGPLRFRPVSDAPTTAKRDVWSLKSASDYADLRQMLRSRTVQWQPLSLGDWKLGAAVGPARTLSTQAGSNATQLAVMPMASFQTRQGEWRLGVMPSAGPSDTATLVVRLKIKAF